MARSKPLIGLAKSGDHVTKTSTHLGNPGLEDDERIEALSLGAGNTGRLFDLETNHRVAEFKFIQWRGGPESIRQNGLFKDFFYLAEAETSKGRYLYLLELDRPIKFLNGGRALSSILTKDQRLRNDFETLYGQRFSVARDYYLYRRDRVYLCDLRKLVPAFATLPSISEDLIGPNGPFLVSSAEGR
jgi:hypothetical protein